MYASLDSLYSYLKQVQRNEENDELLFNILKRAMSIIDLALGFSFAGYAEGQKVVRLDYPSELLFVEPHKPNSITNILRDDGVEFGSCWQAEDGAISCWPHQWQRGAYQITAEWGYGESQPAALEEVCLEIAVNIWGSRDARRFSNVLFSAQSGQVGYEGALTSLQKKVINDIKAQYESEPVVV